jgi:hypothetical protein
MRYCGTKHEILNEIEEKREIVVDIEMRKKNWAAINKNEVKMNSVARNVGIEYCKLERTEKLDFYWDKVSRLLLLLVVVIRARSQGSRLHCSH